MPNPYTGTDNDPISAAQHMYLGKDWEKFFSMLGSRVRMSAQGPGAPVALGGAGRTDRGSGSAATYGSLGGRIGDEDIARTNEVNAYLGQLTDENKLKAQADLDMSAHNRAVSQQDAERQTAQRALAIANDPRTSQYGRPIANTGEETYQTLGPDGAPVNRQAIAAQMAPGLIQPPAPAAPVTFGAPVKAVVNGKPTFVRTGSDGMTYDMARRPIDPATLAPADDQNEPLVSIMGPDSRPVLVPRSQAVGKTPASSREQGRPVTSGDAGDVADFDTSKDELAAVRAAISPTDSTGIVSRVGATIPYVTQITGWGSDAKKRQAVIDRVKQVIGKTLEGGVLRKEDEAKYEKILPNIGDAPDVAKAKLDGLDAAIDKRKQRRLDALKDAGYETSQFEKRDGKAGGGGGGMVMLQPPGGGPPRPVPADQADHYIKLGATVVR